MDFAAGGFDQQVVIESPTPVSGDFGLTGEKTWAPVHPTLAFIWASVKPQRGAERLRAEQQGEETLYLIRIRYLAAVDSTCRVLWSGKTIALSSVVDVNGRHVDMELVGHTRD